MTTMTTITTTKNRQTGTIIELGHQDCFGVDNGAFVWITYCQKHEQFIGHETKKIARWFASSPINWCEGCANSQLGL